MIFINKIFTEFLLIILKKLNYFCLNNLIYSLIIRFINGVIDRYSNNSQKSVNMIQILNDLSSIEDGFNVNSLTKGLLILNETNFDFDEKTSKKFIQTLSNFIEVFSTLKNDMSLNQSKNIKTIFMNSFENLVNKYAEIISKNLTSELKLNFTNIKGIIKSMHSFYGKNKIIIDMKDDFAGTPLESMKIELPDYLSKKLENKLDDIIIQFTSWYLKKKHNFFTILKYFKAYNFLIKKKRSSSVFENNNEEGIMPSNKFFSDVITIDFKYKKDMEKLEIINTDKPIKITIPKLYQKKKIIKKEDIAEKIFICLYYNKEINEWINNNVSFKYEEEDSIICETWHLSDFSVQLTNNNSLIDKYLKPQFLPIMIRRKEEVIRILPPIIYFSFIILIMITTLFIKKLTKMNKSTISEKNEKQHVKLVNSSVITNNPTPDKNESMGMEKIHEPKYAWGEYFIKFFFNRL